MQTIEEIISDIARQVIQGGGITIPEKEAFATQIRASHDAEIEAAGNVIVNKLQLEIVLTQNAEYKADVTEIAGAVATIDRRYNLFDKVQTIRPGAGVLAIVTQHRGTIMQIIRDLKTENIFGGLVEIAKKHAHLIPKK